MTTILIEKSSVYNEMEIDESSSLKALSPSPSAPPIQYDPFKALDLFARNSVLARAIETEQFQFEVKPNLQNWDWECESLKSFNGRKNTCCTLLISGETVSTYKNFGMLFNAETSDIFHAASHDINSYVDNDGSMPLPQKEGTLENMSLESLRKYILSTPVSQRDAMNEVNAHFKAKDILGLYINKMDTQSPVAALLNLQILFIQNHVKIKHGLDLPLFIYDTQKGEMDLAAETTSKVRSLLVRSKPLLDLDTLRHIAKPLGYSIDPKGRIESLKMQDLEPFPGKENKSIL